MIIASLLLLTTKLLVLAIVLLATLTALLVLLAGLGLITLGDVRFLACGLEQLSGLGNAQLFLRYSSCSATSELAASRPRLCCMAVFAGDIFTNVDMAVLEKAALKPSNAS